MSFGEDQLPERRYDVLQLGFSNGESCESQVLPRRDDTADVLKPMPMGLTQAAIKAALQWRFETPMVDGEPSEVFGHYTITFRLNDTP